MKKILITMMALLAVASSAFAADFRDYRDYNLSADDFVEQYEGWGFTTAYEEAKIKLWGDGCSGWNEFCSSRLASDWKLQHAAAYIVADLVQNHDKDLQRAVEYVQVITTDQDANFYRDGFQWFTDNPWDIDNVDDLIDEYQNPTKKTFKLSIVVDIKDKEVSSDYFQD